MFPTTTPKKWSPVWGPTLLNDHLALGSFVPRQIRTNLSLAKSDKKTSSMGDLDIASSKMDWEVWDVFEILPSLPDIFVESRNKKGKLIDLKHSYGFWSFPLHKTSQNHLRVGGLSPGITSSRHRQCCWGLLGWKKRALLHPFPPSTMAHSVQEHLKMHQFFDMCMYTINVYMYVYLYMQMYMCTYWKCACNVTLSVCVCIRYTYIYKSVYLSIFPLSQCGLHLLIHMKFLRQVTSRLDRGRAEFLWLRTLFGEMGTYGYVCIYL